MTRVEPRYMASTMNWVSGNPPSAGRIREKTSSIPYSSSKGCAFTASAEPSISRTSVRVADYYEPDDIIKSEGLSYSIPVIGARVGNEAIGSKLYESGIGFLRVRFG